MAHDPITLEDLKGWNDQIDVFNNKNNDISKMTFADDVPPEFVALWQARIDADKVFWDAWEKLQN